LTENNNSSSLPLPRSATLIERIAKNQRQSAQDLLAAIIENKINTWQALEQYNALPENLRLELLRNKEARLILFPSGMGNETEKENKSLATISSLIEDGRNQEAQILFQALPDNLQEDLLLEQSIQDLLNNSPSHSAFANREDSYWKTSTQYMSSLNN
jgi:hypothetical protein